MAENNPVDKIQPGKSREITESSSNMPRSSSFEKYMQTPSNSPSTKKVPSASEFSPSLQKPTLASIKGQANSVDASLDSLHAQLKANPNLKMKAQHARLLEDKLKQSNKHLKEASQNLGIPSSALKKPASKGPIHRFLGYVTNGQKQILEAKKKLETLKTEGSLNPADLILVQVKLSQAQQDLEYSSILLGKVVDMFKQIMNIQI